MTDQEKEVRINLVDTPTELLFVYFSLCVIHEKWKMADWCHDELLSRKFDTVTIENHTKVFRPLYDQIIDPLNEKL